jgi:hypothetical protein
MKKNDEVTVSDETPVEASVAPESGTPQPREGTGFWHIPIAYKKKIRKLSLNEVRAECVRLAGALMDQRNANYILLKKLEAMKASQTNQPMEGQSNE